MRHVLVIVIFAAVLGGGCGPRPAPAPPAPPGGTRVVVDDLGRRVAVPASPRRIVCTSPELTEILFAVGAGSRVVGVVRGCDWPPAARRLPLVGDFSNVSLERVAALSPDLVLATGHEQDRMLEQLRPLGVPTAAFMARDIAGVRRNITTVGALVGAESNARGVVAAFDAALARVDAEVARVPAGRRPRVYLEISPEPLMTVAAGSFVHEEIRRAGGVNIGADLPRPYCRIDGEEVIARDPEVIILCHGATSPRALAARTGWRGISAVRAGRVYEANPDLVLRAGPRLAEGVAQLHALFYRRPGPARPKT